MNKKDKEEIRYLIVDALNEVMIPALDKLQVQIDDIKDTMATREESASKKDIDRLERKQNARESQQDRFGNKI